MRKYISAIIGILIILLACISCAPPTENNEEQDMGYDYYAINMNTDFAPAKGLEKVESKPARVILLIGQSNASGASVNEYLKSAVGKERYAHYEAGFENVLINYCIDNHNASSEGEFVPVDMTCGASDGFFGPEVGMAEVLSEAFPDEKVFILKFTMSGYSLNYHWLYHYERASVYSAFKIFVDTYMEALKNAGYAATLDAVCWMQGESDTTEAKAARYYDNTEAFVSYLREDFSNYANKNGIYFIDAGISSSPYCEPCYPEVNEAKERFSHTSDKNIYFSTIAAGLTTLYEPEYEPDLGHYDALCELELGRMFGREILKIYGISVEVEK